LVSSICPNWEWIVVSLVAQRIHSTKLLASIEAVTPKATVATTKVERHPWRNTFRQASVALLEKRTVSGLSIRIQG
jgi:hypothetical protein